MARGRRPTSTEPSRGTLASRAFRDRRKQEKIDLEREVSRLQKIVESLEEENEALRSGRPVPNPSSSSSTSTSSAKKRRLSVISSSSSTQPNQHLCSSCGGIAKTDEDEEMARAESADTISSRRSRAKSSKSRSGGSTSRSTVSDNSGSVTSSSIRDSSSSKSNVTSPNDTKSDGGDGEERSLALESGFQSQLWNPPQFGFPISNSNLESSNGPITVQRPHTSGGFSLNHILEPNPSSLARLAQGQILHNPSFQNPAFQFFVNQPIDSSQMNGVQSTQQIINGQPIQTYQTSSGSSIHPPPPHFHHHSGSTANQSRKLWQTGPDVNSSTELDRESSSNFTHARSSSLGRNELCNNAFGALDANSCCWGLLNCGDERSSNNFRESAFPFPRLQ